MTWNYRVVRRDDLDGDWYSVHEAYYHKDGTCWALTEGGIQLEGETLAGLLDTYQILKEAFEQPVLSYRTRKPIA